MIVELKSLLPALSHSSEEDSSLFRETFRHREALPPETDSFFLPPMPAEAEKEEASHPDSIPSADETKLSLLLEQLLRNAERNTASTEKIAELLESRENTAVPLYN